MENIVWEFGKTISFEIREKTKYCSGIRENRNICSGIDELVFWLRNSGNEKNEKIRSGIQESNFCVI